MSAKGTFSILASWCLAMVLLSCSDDEPGGTADTGLDAVTDLTGDTTQPDTSDQEGCIPAPPWDVVVNLDIDGESTPVNLGCLERTTFDSQDAIRLTRVVETAALEAPWNYHYNFIGSDGFNPLIDRLENDLAQLPYFGEIDSGYLYWDEGSLRVGWEESLGFPNSLKVRGMAGGTIELIEFDPTSLIIHAGEIRSLVDLSTMDTVSVVDYRHPEEDPVDVVLLADVLEEAGLTDGAAFDYKITGMDGFSNNDNNLMPFTHAQHAYIQPDGRKILFDDEAWDTEECCWRVRDVVVIRGIPAEECIPEPPWDVEVNLKIGETSTPVNLGCLERTTFESQDAVQLTQVVATAELETPWSYHFNFIGSDGFNPLVERMDNDLAGLPYYGELELGYLYWDEDALRVGWDASLGFPGFLKVSGMVGGTIELIEFDSASLIVQVGEIRELVDLSTLTTTEVVDYRHPEDDPLAVVPLTDVLEEAGLTDGSGFDYKLTATDGFANGDDNLMPFTNAEHAYIEPTERKIIFAEESWDTTVCCWRIKDVVLIQGVATQQ
ncbi:MAG: hypothetical protein JW797_01160 [Bradymonadales bacterium]|nr:hypothetical protein [Bradymonadales bacterium]